MVIASWYWWYINDKIVDNLYLVYLAIILCIVGNIEIRDFKSLFSNDNCMISITDLFDMPIKPCNSIKLNLIFFKVVCLIRS